MLCHDARMATAEFDDDVLALLYAAAERLGKPPSAILRDAVVNLLKSLGIDPAEMHEE